MYLQGVQNDDHLIHYLPLRRRWNRWSSWKDCRILLAYFPHLILSPLAMCVSGGILKTKLIAKIIVVGLWLSAGGGGGLQGDAKCWT